MRPQAPAYLRIPYTNYPALACYWVRRPQYGRENTIQGWYRGTYTSVLGTYRTYTTRHGTVLRYVPSAQIDLGTVPNTAYRTGYRTVGTHLGRNPYSWAHPGKTCRISVRAGTAYVTVNFFLTSHVQVCRARC